MIICIYDVTKYGSCMIDDLLFDMLDDYSFEMIFWNYYHSLKKDCADRHFEITYFSISGQHNLLKDFLWFPFRNDIWLSFRNEQCVPIFILKCFMTVILKWGVENFRTQNYFGQENTKYFNDENTTILYFSYTDFYARHCVPILALK